MAGMISRLGVAIAVVALFPAASGSSPAPGQTAIDWGSIKSFAETYHAVTITKGGDREEVTGTSTITFNRSVPGPHGIESYIFDGTSDVQARTSGPPPSGPCAFQIANPNHRAQKSGVPIQLILNLQNRTYEWDAQPVAIHFMQGGYSPNCGGSKAALTSSDIGMATVGNVPIPTTTQMLCGKAVFTDSGDFTAYVDWIFYPTGSKIPPAPQCPGVPKATGGTS